MPRCLLYVSRSLVPEDIAPLAVGDIVAVARARNAALDVTGALLFSGVRFAQLLEGPGDAVEDLMRSIRADERHTNVIVVRDGCMGEREFPTWTLAYSGFSSFIDKHIEAAAEQMPNASERAREQDAARLVRLMKEFKRTPGG